MQKSSIVHVPSLPLAMANEAACVRYRKRLHFFSVNETVFLDFKKREFCYCTDKLEVTFLLQIVAGIRV